ncbi:MAG: hypothetical protein CMO01_27260 [Thalassobius sp.]|nr:hypothetical protein [Thalassovita sp.]
MMSDISQEFVSVSQAIKLTGKSISTLRRFIDKTKKLPNSSELLKKKEEGKTSPIYIKKKYLLETFGSPLSQSYTSDGEVLKDLKDRIKYLEKQLDMHQQQKIKSDEMIYHLVKEVSDLRSELNKVVSHK